MNKPLRILAVNMIWMTPAHGAGAANVIGFELLRGLAKEANTTVGFLKINREGEAPPTLAEQAGITAFKECGIEVLPPVTVPKNLLPPRSRWQRVLSPHITDYYPEVAAKDLVHRRIATFNPDLVFVLLSEPATAICSDVPAVKMVQYSNPDPKQARALSAFQYRHGTSDWRSFMLQRYSNYFREKFHLSIARQYEIWSVIAPNDTQYYRKKGLAHAIYIPNLWIDRIPDWKTRRREQPGKIIANIGRLNATANSHGLEVLGRELLPALAKTLEGIPYEIHIIGGGTLHPALQKFFDRPEVHMRGYVEDIDAEILSSPILLSTNNASSYKVAHTRYVHAWSLGTCVIAHQDATLSMPELVHRRNALLGKNISDMAALVKEALQNPSLRSSIATQAYADFKEHHTGEKIAKKVIQAYVDYVS